MPDDAPALTLLDLIALWYDLASSGTLTPTQLLQLRNMFTDAARRYDGTVALLKAQTALLAEMDQTIQQQTAHIARLTTALTQAGGSPPLLH